MLSSRAFQFMRSSIFQAGRLRKHPMINQKRHHGDDGWHYRKDQPVDHKMEFYADCVGGFMWWWILYHVYHDYDHLIGHHDYPDPLKWTDAELGIPPDDQVYEDFNPDTCVHPRGFYNKKE